MHRIAFYRPIKKQVSQSGFTLVEMAIVIIIVGLLIAMFAPVYNTYRANIALQITKDNLAEVEYRIQAFRKKYGRYPLPASYTAKRGDPDAVDLVMQGDPEYGYESDWNGDGDPLYAQPFELPSNNFTNNPDWDNPNDPNVGTTIYASNTCNEGICIRLGNRQTLDLNPVDFVVDTVPRVRVGAVPFRALDLEEDQSLDGYGRRLTYAVVERLARATTYDETGGAIGITDSTGVSLIADIDDPAVESVAHFVLFSHGPNGYGAYTRDGRQLPCDGDSIDLTNTVCDGASGPAIFIADQTTTVADNTEFDDTFSSFLREMPPSWKFSESDPGDIFIDIDGPVGIQTDEPQERLDVNGTVHADEGVFSDMLCEQSQPGACFSSAFLAGPPNDTPGNGRNTCPDGEFMVGIKNSEVICQPNVQVSCPVGEIMTGVSDAGEPLCQNVPDCLSMSHSVCGTAYTIASRDIGETFVSGATEPYITSTCTAVGWQHQQTGACPIVTCVVKATSFSSFAPLSGSKLVGSDCTCGTSVTRCHNEYNQRGSGCSCSTL